MKKYGLLLTCVAIFIVSLLFRFTTQVTPFWVDEFSTAEQAKLLIKYGMRVFEQNSNYFESNNILTHFVLSVSFLLFGIGEWQARLPMMLIGSMVPVALYLFARSTFNQRTAFISSALYIFSYLQITWARQARGYVLQQLLVLLLLFVYQKLMQKFTVQRLIAILFISILGVLTHTTFILILFALLLHFVIFHRANVIKHKNQVILIFVSLSILLLIMFYSGQVTSVLNNIKLLFIDLPNNIAYYHSFLWREQTLISIFAFIGSIFLIVKQKKYVDASLLLFPVALYLTFVSFLFTPYVSRYLLPVFPLLIILAGIAIANISLNTSEKYSLIISILIVVFIVINGDKFVLKPKAFYSVNHDMREVALVDYVAVYDLIKLKGRLAEGRTAVIDPWPDRQKWYLGENRNYFYSFRWIADDGLLNGLVKNTPFEINDKGEKYIPRTGDPAIKLIGTVIDLEAAMDKFPKGFIWIDDSSLPADVIAYAEKNLKKELYLDHYPLDDNPYSIWPGTLYSWGVD